MNLHEQYKTLLRRGMPELDYTATGLHWDGITLIVGNHRLADAPARDLVTAHVVRWGISLGMVIIDGKPEVTYPVFAMALMYLPPRKTHIEPESGKILDAILAATEHLEPKAAQ